MNDYQQPILSETSFPVNRQEVHYNKIAEVYSRARQEHLCNKLYYQYMADCLWAFVPAIISSAKNLVILDPMCGSGELIGEILQRFENRVSAVYGIDISEKMLDKTPPEISKNALVHLQKGDVRKLPFTNEFFDLVLIRGGLHHVYKDLPSTLVELARVLKPGGCFLFVEPSDDNPLIALFRRVLYTRHEMFVAEEEQGLKSGDLKKALLMAGFHQIQLSPFGYVAYTLIGNTDVFPLLRKLSKRPLIQGLILMDEFWRKIPGLNRFNLVMIGQAIK